MSDEEEGASRGYIQEGKERGRRVSARGKACGFEGRKSRLNEWLYPGVTRQRAS